MDLPLANIQTRAIKEGDYYIVNGSKTFITNGIYGQFVILVCKTNPEAGAAGVSLLVLDLDAEGVSKNKLKKLGWQHKLAFADTGLFIYRDANKPPKRVVDAI